MAPPVPRVAFACPTPSFTSAVTADGSALRVFSQFPVLLDMSLHTARYVDGTCPAAVGDGPRWRHPRVSHVDALTHLVR